MRVRALKTTFGSYGTLPRGRVAEVNDHEAKEMISLGYMIEDLPLAKQEAAPVAANDNIPFEIAQTGGLTGADAPQSLSPEGQVPQQPAWNAPAPRETLESLPSTTDTGSAKSAEEKRTSSTPATTTGGKRKRGRPSSKG